MVNMNCTIKDHLPAWDELYNSHPRSYLALLVVALVLFLMINVLCIIHVYYTWKYVSADRVRNKLLVLCFLYPILASFCLAAMLSPRVGPIFQSVGVVYILYCVYNTVSLSRVVYREEENLVQALQDEDYNMMLRVPPLCCCIPCMPKLTPTVATLQWFERFVMQAIFLRFAMEFVNIFLLAEYGAESAKLIHYVDLFGVPSLLFSVFAAQVMIRLSTEYLREHKMMALFYCVIMTLPFYCMQPALLFELLFIKLNFFPCGPLLSIHGNARYVFNFVMICELLIISIVASLLVVPKKTVLFDRYYQKENEETTTPLKTACTTHL